MELEIKTNLERQTVKIDGKAYQIVNIAEINIKTYKLIESYSLELNALNDKDKLKKTKRGLDIIIDKILVAPFFIKRKIKKSMNNEMAIIDFFLQKVAKDRANMQSSPGSNVSTAEN